MMRSHLTWLLPAALLACPAIAAAGPLGVVNVGAPAINCVFSPSCTTSGPDTIANIPLPGISGPARLQSRTTTGLAGAPAAGLTGYEYRVDLTSAVGILNIPCVSALRVSFGPVAALQYNGVGPLDQVYVVTAGGLGTIGLASANQTGDDITFTFSRPVCAGGSPGTGDTSYFVGVTSTRAPTAVTAIASPTGGGSLSVGARAPNLDKCTTGARFSSPTDACVASVCAADSFCCTTAWDSLCVTEVRTVCGSLSCAEANGTCTHSLCASGPALVDSCDGSEADCVSEICDVDSFCCTTAWDAVCSSEVNSVCGNNCN
jgi:hypothetical protein